MFTDCVSGGGVAVDCTLAFQARSEGARPVPPLQTLPADQLHFRTGTIGEVKELVLAHHYSHAWPGVTILVASLHEPGGLFGWAGPAVAGIVFGIPASMWAEPVIELQRLVRRPDVRVPLTLLVSLSCRVLRKKGFDLLISYADQKETEEKPFHLGTIYQAAGWNYHGEKPGDRRVVINGQSFHGRTIGSRYGTRSPSKLREILKTDVENQQEAPKFLYWKSLGRKGEEKAKRLGLKSIQYPKGGQNHEMNFGGSMSGTTKR